MKVWILIIISFFSPNLIKNANSVGEGGQGSKLYKTFDEIFGKGWDDESNDSKDLNCRHVKEEVQDVQAPNTSDQKNIKDKILKQKFDEIYDENWSEDENNSADDLDRENSKEHLSAQNNSTDQDESVGDQQNNSNKCEKIKSDQQKSEIIQKFCEMKEDYTKKRQYSANEHLQIEKKISNNLGVGRTTIYKWRKELGLSRETKSKSTDQQKLQILKQFDEIKSKCQKAKLKNISIYELDDKIAKKLGVSRVTIYVWKRKFGLSGRNKISDATKIGILKKYAKIKGKNPKMIDRDIAKMLEISTQSLSKWKKQFKEEIKNI